MKIGMVGLGRMGSNMAHRLMQGGHQCVVFDLSSERVSKLAAKGAAAAAALVDLAQKLEKPRAIWTMLPAGDPTEQTVTTVAEPLEPGAPLIDGGNSYYKDDVRRAATLRARGIRYIDAGTSGGVWGSDRGYCLMLGGEKQAVADLQPIFKTLAPGLGDIPRTPGMAQAAGTAEQGFLHCGPSGAGHFVKMIHNGIEYGLMQSYAEGFDILRNANSTSLPENCPSHLNILA